MQAVCVAAVNHVAEDPEFVRELDNFLNIYSPVVKRQGVEFMAAFKSIRTDFDRRVNGTLRTQNMNRIQSSKKITEALRKSEVFLHDLFNLPKLREIVFDDHFRTYFLRETLGVQLVDPALIQTSRPSLLVTLSRFGSQLIARFQESLIEVPSYAARRESLRVARPNTREIALFKDKIWITNEPENEEHPRLWTTEQGGVALQMREQFIYAGKSFTLFVNGDSDVCLRIKTVSNQIELNLTDTQIQFDPDNQTRRVWLLPPGPTGLFIKMVIKNNRCHCSGDGMTACGCIAELKSVHISDDSGMLSLSSPDYRGPLNLTTTLLNFAINPLHQLPLIANFNHNVQISLDGSSFAVCSVLGGRYPITLKIPSDVSKSKYLRSAILSSGPVICILGSNADIIHLMCHY